MESSSQRPKGGRLHHWSPIYHVPGRDSFVEYERGREGEREDFHMHGIYIYGEPSHPSVKPYIVFSDWCPFSKVCFSFDFLWLEMLGIKNGSSACKAPALLLLAHCSVLHHQVYNMHHQWWTAPPTTAGHVFWRGDWEQQVDLTKIDGLPNADHKSRGAPMC